MLYPFFLRPPSFPEKPPAKSRRQPRRAQTDDVMIIFMPAIGFKHHLILKNPTKAKFVLASGGHEPFKIERDHEGMSTEMYDY